MAIVAGKSTNIIALDTQPIVQLTSGEGNPGFLKVQTDRVTTTAAQMASIGSTLRLCRIPTTAKLKQMLINLGGVDTNATALAVFDVNIAFSDSAFDGTPQAVQGAIPTSAFTGAVTTIGTYASPNILLGTIAAANSGARKIQQDQTFAATTFTAAMQDIPLWAIFGFTTGQGIPQDPGGFFDVLLYLSAAAATGAAAVVSVETRFVL